MEADVLVIGGGPAGLAAAIAAAQRGMTVEVAEPCVGPVDKCCGEGLLPSALRALGDLGIPRHLLLEHGVPLSGIRFHHAGRTACTSFGDPGDCSPAIGMRRTSLHALLAKRARSLGVQLTPQSAHIRRDGARVRAWVGEARREPRWLVGADGSQSAVRKASMLEAGRTISRRFALRQHFQLAQDQSSSHVVEVHWASGAQAYVTPVGEGRVGVAVLSSSRQSSLAAALNSFPSVQKLLVGAQTCSPVRGALSSNRTLSAVHIAQLALVGDASGSVDAITGDGLSLGFRQALALGEALSRGDLQLYGEVHRKLVAPARVMSRALLTMGSSVAVTRLSMLALSGIPGLFSGLFHLHTRAPGWVSGRKAETRWQSAPISTKSTT